MRNKNNSSIPITYLLLDYYTRIGWIKKIEEETGCIINPTHDLQLLKETRLKLYKKVLEEFTKERTVKKLTTDNKDLNIFESTWLKNELEVINEWLSLSTSDQIELNKYEQFVSNKLEKLNKELEKMQKQKNCPLFRTPNTTCPQTATCTNYEDWNKKISGYDLHYNFDPLDFTKLTEELEAKKDIIERLEHWYNEYWTPLYSKIYINIVNIQKRTSIIQYQEQLNNPSFGNCGGVISIPTPVFDKFFSQDWETKESLYWRMQFDSKYYFLDILYYQEWHEKLASGIVSQTIQRELNKIETFENKASDLYTSGKIDIYDRQNLTNSKYEDYVYYLRIEANYYQNHPIKDYYFKVQHLNTIHKHLKPFLQKELAKRSIKQPLNKQVSNISSSPSFKDPSFLELFRMNQERLDKFILLLQSDAIQALDKNYNWIYNSRKSSIVACFQVLEDLEFIKTVANKASLRRCIESKLNFKGDKKLFRNPINDDDYVIFKRLFSNNL